MRQHLSRTQMVAVALGVVLGLVAARVVLVGSAVTLVPRAVAALDLGLARFGAVCGVALALAGAVLRRRLRPR